MKKVYGYIRVSTERQVADGISMVDQEATIQAYYDYKLKPAGYTFGAWFRDPAKSGTIPFFSRPAGFKLSTTAEPGDAIVITKLDRGFRNLKDLLFTMETWQAQRINVHLLDMNVDTSTGIGKLIISVIGAVAEFERGLMHERIKSSKNRLRALGIATEASMFGYKKVPDGNGRKIFVPCPEQRAIADKILRLHEGGMKCDDVRLQLIKERIKWNGGYLCQSRVVHWVRNERQLRIWEAHGLDPRRMTLDEYTGRVPLEQTIANMRERMPPASRQLEDCPSQ